MTPTDRTELRRLATAAKKYGFNNHRVGDFRVAASPDVVLALLTDFDALRALITKLHAAKGRYHTQLVCCDLFDAVGLKNERPVK